MNFRPRPKWDRTPLNFPKNLKHKTKTFVYSPPLKKSKLFSIFFLLDLVQKMSLINWAKNIPKFLHMTEWEFPKDEISVQCNSH